MALLLEPLANWQIKLYEKACDYLEQKKAKLPLKKTGRKRTGVYSYNQISEVLYADEMKEYAAGIRKTEPKLLSRQRVQQIEAQALRHLREEIKMSEYRKLLSYYQD